MLAWLLGCASLSDPRVASDRISALRPVLDAMVSRRVDFLRDQDWCRALSYQRGDFLSSTHPSTCVLDPAFGAGGPFDPEAEADLRGWSSGFSGAGFPIHWVTIDYGPDGAPTAIDAASSRTFGRLSYRWSSLAPPEALPGEIEAAPVPGQAGWFVVVEDWN